MKVIDLDKEIKELIEWSERFIPTAQLTGAELQRLTSPCIYGWRRSNEWLYIGYSKEGLTRLISRQHKVFVKFEIWDTDELFVWQPKGISQKDLKGLEEVLIAMLSPKYNIYLKEDSKTNRRKVRIRDGEKVLEIFQIEKKT